MTLYGRWLMRRRTHPDVALTPEKVGLQPYAATEAWERLKSAMRDYRGLEKDHKEVKPVECEICVSGGGDGALGGGRVAAAAYDDPVQRVDGAEPERLLDAAYGACDFRVARL